MSIKNLSRPAFTMIELMFVIIILGIVSSIGAEVIAKVYKNYILQRAQHRASLKTELAALQISNRLRYVIPHTVYRIKNDNSLESMDTILTESGDNYKGVQWVGYDGDSFEAITSNTDSRSGWSGFCDLNASSREHIKTPGSNLQLSMDIIGNLASRTTVYSEINLYFPSVFGESHTVSSVDVPNSFIKLHAPMAPLTNRKIFEQYKLAWTSYALVVRGEDLYLYYDFIPTAGTERGTTKSLLMNNVSTFKFKGTAGTLRFKICQYEQITEDVNITSCKEKAVF